MTDKEYQSLADLLSKPKKILITTHRSPDGDAIGSSLGLRIILARMGHSVTIAVPNDYPKFLHWMPHQSEIIDFEKDSERIQHAAAGAELHFSLDYNNYSRIGGMQQLAEDLSCTRILIDHHLEPADYFDYTISNTKASSTCEMIYDFAIQMGVKSYIDSACAECLYTGLMTDSGSFRFSSTSAHTHEVVAELMKVGLQPWKVYNEVMDTNTISKLKLTGYALSNKMELVDDLPAVIIALSQNEKNRFAYQKGDTEGLVNYGLSIEGVRFSAFLSEETDYVKLSLRSQGAIDVNLLARKYFNGGGHQNAAGGKIDGDLGRAILMVKETLRKEKQIFQ